MATKARAYAEQARADYDTDDASWIAPVSHPFPIVKALRYDRRSYIAVRLLDRLIRAADAVLPPP
ncbi:MAG TPA: hypothetical protein VIM11_09380 [Tepidisphaeraceae bacterium]|jgi:hypothetical protein